MVSGSKFPSRVRSWLSLMPGHVKVSQSTALTWSHQSHLTSATLGSQRASAALSCPFLRRKGSPDSASVLPPQLQEKHLPLATGTGHKRSTGSQVMVQCFHFQSASTSCLPLLYLSTNFLQKGKPTFDESQWVASHIQLPQLPAVPKGSR